MDRGNEKTKPIQSQSRHAPNSVEWANFMLMICQKKENISRFNVTLKSAGRLIQYGLWIFKLRGIAFTRLFLN